MPRPRSARPASPCAARAWQTCPSTALASLPPWDWSAASAAAAAAAVTAAAQWHTVMCRWAAPSRAYPTQVRGQNTGAPLHPLHPIGCLVSFPVCDLHCSQPRRLSCWHQQTCTRVPASPAAGITERRPWVHVARACLYDGARFHGAAQELRPRRVKAGARGTNTWCFDGGESTLLVRCPTELLPRAQVRSRVTCSRGAEHGGLCASCTEQKTLQGVGNRVLGPAAGDSL